LDIGVRQLKLALRTPDFVKTPTAAAIVRSTIKTLARLISVASGGRPGGAPADSDGRGAPAEDVMGLAVSSDLTRSQPQSANDEGEE
jgi:hypothetical protein